MATEDFDTQFWQQTRQQAERLLVQSWATPVRLEGEPAHLGGSHRSLVYRFNLVEGPSQAPASLIVKRANPKAGPGYQPDLAEAPAWTLFNEWASLQFLGEVGLEQPLSPRFYGGDRTQGLIVMEDLGSGQRLDHFLLGSDPGAARTALLEYAQVHGRLHAATSGKSDRYTQIRQPLGPVAASLEPLEWIVPTFEKMAATLQVTVSEQARRELVALVARTRDYNGPFKTFIQSDSCPDNLLKTASGWQLIDFEGAGFNFCLIDGVYPRMRFPTCWCVNDLPAEVLEAMEQAYRTELVKAIAEAADDKLFYQAMCEACVLWLITWFWSFSLEKQLEQDTDWKQATVRQRSLARFEVVRQTTSQFGYLEGLGEAIGQLGERLGQRWADTVPMALYPAFI
jgi:hypothetical protein